MAFGLKGAVLLVLPSGYIIPSSYTLHTWCLAGAISITRLEVGSITVASSKTFHTTGGARPSAIRLADRESAGIWEAISTGEGGVASDMSEATAPSPVLMASQIPALYSCRRRNGAVEGAIAASRDEIVKWAAATS